MAKITREYGCRRSPIHSPAPGQSRRGREGPCQDTSNETAIGATIGGVGGALVGLIFPPSLLATAAVGAGIGAGSGAVIGRVARRKVKQEVEWAVPVGGSGIVVIFDEQWVNEVEKALTRADRIARDHLHGDDDAETAEGAPTVDL